ncbi:MAG TPA: hypothetical protein VN949_00280 [Candidatus Limnocylindrales bacterium]|nr:hypothetical protein [Candidatus Limnocylindrales bacterium]
MEVFGVLGLDLLKLYPTPAIPTTIRITANTTGNSIAAKYETSKRTPKPVIRAPQPTTIILGGAYEFAGGKTNASTIIHAPKNVKIKGKTAKMVSPVRSDARISPPRIIRKTLALKGAQGTRFIQINKSQTTPCL